MGTTIAQKIGLSEKQADTIKKVAIGVGTAALGVGIFMLAKHMKGAKNRVNIIEKLKEVDKPKVIDCTESDLGLFTEKSDALKDIQAFMDGKSGTGTTVLKPYKKLKLLMDGQPGSGKTSVVEALEKQIGKEELAKIIDKSKIGDKFKELNEINISKFIKKA